MAAVSRSVKRDIADHPAVVSVGETEMDGVRVLRVVVEFGSPIPDTPDSVGDLPVVVERGGRLSPLTVDHAQDTLLHVEKVRPVHPGVSGGPTNSTGTLGFVVTDGAQRYLTSNWHVFAADGLGEPGVSILQPGSADGGLAPEDVVAEDAEWTEPTDGAEMDFAAAPAVVDTNPGVLGVGPVRPRTREPALGEEIVKSGKETGTLTGTVTEVDVTATVSYAGKEVTYDGLFKTTGVAVGGDSGSPVVSASVDVNGRARPLGMVTAGTEQETVHTPLTAVVSNTRFSLVGGGDDGFDDVVDEPDFDPADVSIDRCFIGNSQIQPGESIEIRVFIDNRNDGEASWEANLFADGEFVTALTGVANAASETEFRYAINYTELLSAAGTGLVDVDAELISVAPTE